jgi:hypothetical protein
LTHAHSGHTGVKDAVKTATQGTTAMHLADATSHLKSTDRYLTSTNSLPFGRFALDVQSRGPHAGRSLVQVGDDVFTATRRSLEKSAPNPYLRIR